MFVRKGTVRKNRRSIRRPRAETSGKGNNNITARKGGLQNDQSSTGSVSYRLATNSNENASKSSVTNSVAKAGSFGDTSVYSLTRNDVDNPGNTRKMDTVRFKDDLYRHSPARSIANTVVSFDDERQLVRTSVGWQYQPSLDSQTDYGAFMYQIQEASKEADSIIDLSCKTSRIICNSLLVTVFVGISMTLPVAMVSIGVKYLDDCPKEPRIPVYLLVGGCCGMIKLVSTLWRNIQIRRYQDRDVTFEEHDVEGAFASTTYQTMDTILFLFLLGWLAAGTYWTMKIWTPHYQQLLHEPSNWCDKTVYMFTVYQTFGCYGVMVFFLLVLFLLMCCQRCCF